MSRKYFKTIIGVLVVIAIFVFAFWSGNYIQDHPAVHGFIASFGYAGIVILAFLSGVNPLFPIPVIAFVPVFIASGFSMPEIIASLVVGTTFADLVAFYLGTLGRTYTLNSNSPVVHFFVGCCRGRPIIAGIVVFFFGAIIPLPNELLLIPLGALGYRLRELVIPLILGTITHFIIFAYSIEAIFEIIF